MVFTLGLSCYSSLPTITNTLEFDSLPFWYFPSPEHNVIFYFLLWKEEKENNPISYWVLLRQFSSYIWLSLTLPGYSHRGYSSNFLDLFSFCKIFWSKFLNIYLKCFHDRYQYKSFLSNFPSLSLKILYQDVGKRAHNQKDKVRSDLEYKVYVFHQPSLWALVRYLILQGTVLCTKVKCII